MSGTLGTVHCNYNLILKWLGKNRFTKCSLRLDFSNSVTFEFHQIDDQRPFELLSFKRFLLNTYPPAIFTYDHIWSSDKHNDMLLCFDIDKKTVICRESVFDGAKLITELINNLMVRMWLWVLNTIQSSRYAPILGAIFAPLHSSVSWSLSL